MTDLEDRFRAEYEADPINRASLPDARLRPCDRTTVVGRFGLMAKVYCVNCGRDGGSITDAWAATVYYLCGRCAETHGKIPGAVEIAESTIRGTA